MVAQHLVRVGLFGQVGRFTSVEGIRYPRRTSVICRTKRGIEVGEVLAEESNTHADNDGAVLRRLTIEDQLILTRLEKHKDQALRACESLIRDHRLAAVLMDVEHLFDGRSLYFYFLGEISPELDALTGQLAAAYDAEVQFHRFAQTLTEGCGPGCGTEEAAGNGCATGGCGSCAVAGACSPRRGN